MALHSHKVLSECKFQVAQRLVESGMSAEQAASIAGVPVAG